MFTTCCMCVIQQIVVDTMDLANECPLLHRRGLRAETLVVDEQQYVVRAWQVSKKVTQRWAALRLLLELGHQVDPAFFRDTPEGRLNPNLLCCAVASETLMALRLTERKER